MSQHIPDEVLLYSLMVYSLHLCDKLEVSNSLKKSVRGIERFTRESFQNLETNEQTSEYQARVIHNITKILDYASREDICLLPVGVLELEQ